MLSPFFLIKGEKIFYMIRPTEENLIAYEAWSRLEKSRQSEVFFGDKVDICYKCVIKQGQTLCIPTGQCTVKVVIFAAHSFSRILCKIQQARIKKPVEIFAIFCIHILDT